MAANMITIRIIAALFTVSYFCLVTVNGNYEAYDFIVQLPKGAIRGLSRKSANGSDFYAFQQIPFASPPVGENRFKAPKPPRAWKGILDATVNTKGCVQFQRRGYHDSNSRISYTEDCLYLNVYTPVKPGSTNLLPVYAFIHGGAYVAGDASYSAFGPNSLIDHNIVVVTLNYRLGALGFLATSDGVIPGNLGLKDQSLALKWVQENIALFGGDPKKVTIGGQSAGSSSAGFQLMSKQNKGLFSGIILQSGTAINTWGLQTNPDKYAFELGNNLDSSLGFTNTSKLLTILMKASAEDIVAADSEVPYRVDAVVPDLNYVPIIEKSDLPDTFISEPMYDSLLKGQFNQVPIMVGFDSEEALSFIRNDDMLDSYVELFDNDPSIMVDEKFNLDPQNKSIVGSELRKLYTNNTSFAENIGALVRYSSDSFITRSSTRHVDIASRYVPTYLYKFSYSDQGQRFPGAENVGHGGDLFYIWDSTRDSLNGNDFDYVIRQRMLKLLTNFIKYQDPTPSRDPLLLNTIWPKVEPGNVKYLNFDKVFTIETNPRQYNEVSSIIDKYVDTTLATY